MRPSQFLPLAFVALVVVGCSGAATAPTAAAPTTAPAAATPAATAEPVASAEPEPTQEPVPTPTAEPSAVAGCLDKDVHAVLYKGLKDPGSLSQDELDALRAGIEAWEPSAEWQEYREWFLGDGGTARQGRRFLHAPGGRDDDRGVPVVRDHPTKVFGQHNRTRSGDVGASRRETFDGREGQCRRQSDRGA